MMTGALAWTDYPFTELGDTEGQEAPVREVRVLSYDGDKYVVVMCEGVRKSIKAGYCYMEPGRHDQVPKLNRRILSQLPRTDG